MTDVTILVAAYNAVATLPQCLDSLCRQTLRDIQIICIDDCSTDSTLSLLKQRAAQDPRITVLQTPVNSGHAVARNLGLRHAQAPLVVMVDADDWLSDDCLEQAVEVFRQHPQTDSVVLRLMQYYETEDRKEDFGLPAELLDGAAISGELAFRLSMDRWRLHGLYLIRTALHQRYPLDTSTRLYSDDNTYRLMYLHCREVRACGGIYYYRKHAASQTISFNFLRFDFMEANLSMKLSMKKENVPADIMRHYEVSRWMTFIRCYRLYLEHEEELTDQQKAELAERFRTILHTFRPSQLSWQCRWKPGYWLTFSPRLFDLQQRTFMKLKRLKN